MNGLVDTIILANAPNGYAQAIVKVRIGNADISTVCLDGYTVITVVYRPVVEGDIGRADRVCSVRIC